MCVVQREWPTRLSGEWFGDCETFLFTFEPDFKVRVKCVLVAPYEPTPDFEATRMRSVFDRHLATSSTLCSALTVTNKWVVLVMSEGVVLVMSE